MELRDKNRHVIDAVFILCLMLLFIISAFAVIIIGAGIYKRNVNTMAENYSQRIACAYITEKVRQSDNMGMIYVDNLFDQNTLVMQEEVDGQLYNTYIYDYNGYLMELYANADLKELYPQSGQKIIEVISFDIKDISDNLMNVEIVINEGDFETIYIAKRSVGK